MSSLPPATANRARKVWSVIGWTTVAGVLLLHVLWQSLWPAAGLPAVVGWTVALLPLLPLALAMLFRLRHQLIYAGIGMLAYFCHGVMESYASPAMRVQAAIEIVLTVVYFAALYMRRRASRGPEHEG